MHRHTHSSCKTLAIPRRWPQATLLTLALGLAATAAAQQTGTPNDGVSAPEARVQVARIQVDGVGEHPGSGIDPLHIQAVADQALRQISPALPASLEFAQIEQITSRITQAYRDAGFLVSVAYIPPQQIDENQTLTLAVMEGRVGRVLVQGSHRYRDDQLSASSRGLVGRPLRKAELERAVLHARELPGVSVSSLLRPGEHPGETDIVLLAEDSARPYQMRFGASNHGSRTIGRYRAEASISTFNALGAGDTLSADVAYGVDPADSWQAAATLKLPSRRRPGFAGVFGVSRSEIELNTGAFAALDIHGPTTAGHAGAEWTLHQQPGLQTSASARWIHQESRLDGLGIELSRHKFDVLEAAINLRHIDVRHHGINMLQASVRKSINDESPAFNWLYAAHDPHYWVGRLALARLQALPGNQQLLLRGNAQFSSSALTPMEQFSLGGPNSVRAFPLSSGLGDRGVLATLEYQVQAPGFADRPSPFAGRRWGELLTLGVFYDWGRASPAADNRQRGVLPTTLEGAGLSLGMQLPWQEGLRLELSAATPTGRARTPDHDDAQVWARVGMTF